ncbi:hypothetical protein [Muricoccus radiodurans]|uniref:hypothetical protein n=1 Tax=Muricoccus radiodurans TaxID=2231721 RepID=UPI003CF65529
MISHLPARAALLTAVIALPLLAGCGSSRNTADGPPCPRVVRLADATDLTRYRAGAVPDIGTVEVAARIEGVRFACSLAPRNAGLDVILTVGVSAERGPGATGRTADLPYFVWVVDRDESRVLNRGSDTLRVQFPPNTNTTTAVGEEMQVRIPGDPRAAAERTVLVGFQLSPEQLEANRRRGTR